MSSLKSKLDYHGSYSGCLASLPGAVQWSGCVVERCRGQWPSQSLLLLIIKNLGLHFPLLMNVFWSWVIRVSVMKPKRLQIKTFFAGYCYYHGMACLCTHTLWDFIVLLLLGNWGSGTDVSRGCEGETVPEVGLEANVKGGTGLETIDVAGHLSWRPATGLHYKLGAWIKEEIGIYKAGMFYWQCN